jgi:hypothetical protein
MIILYTIGISLFILLIVILLYNYTLCVKFKQLNADSIIEQIIQKIDTQARCPKCNGIIHSKMTFCAICGYNFARPEVQARLIRFVREPDDYTCVVIEWECLLCNKCHTDIIPIENKIVTFYCGNCRKHVGETTMAGTPYGRAELSKFVPYKTTRL